MSESKQWTESEIRELIREELAARGPADCHPLEPGPDDMETWLREHFIPGLKKLNLASRVLAARGPSEPFDAGDMETWLREHFIPGLKKLNIQIDTEAIAKRLLFTL